MKEPFDQLTEEDKEIITKYINSYAGCYPGNLQVTLKHWNKSKRTLWKALGHNMRVKIPIEITRNEYSYERLLKEVYNIPPITRYNTTGYWEEYVKEQKQKICNGDNSFIPDFTIYINKLYNNMEISLKDINAIFWVITYSNMVRGKTSSIGVQWFTSTDYADYYEITRIKDNKTIKITNNQKVIKLFQKIVTFCGYTDMKKFEEFRNKISDISTSSSIKTNLVLSIHPIDFMTMSDNNCGWHSCMSWTNHGSYSNGTIEMMNSNMVLVAYLESGTPYYFDNNSIPNKSWRVLVYVHKNILLIGKSYPYTNYEVNKKVLEEVYKLVNKNLKWDYQYKDQEYMDLHPYHDNYMVATRSLSLLSSRYHKRILIYTNGMYNDIIEDKDYIYKCYRNYVDHTIKINASGKCSCMLCGKEIEHVGSDSKYCDKCSDQYRCSNCGTVSMDNELYSVEVFRASDSYSLVRKICSCCIDDYWYDTLHKVALLKQELFDSMISENNHAYNKIYILIGDEEDVVKFSSKVLPSVKFGSFYSFNYYFKQFIEYSGYSKKSIDNELKEYNLTYCSICNPKDLQKIDEMVYYHQSKSNPDLSYLTLKEGYTVEDIQEMQLGMSKNLITLRKFLEDRDKYEISNSSSI